MIGLNEKPLEILDVEEKDLTKSLERNVKIEVVCKKSIQNDSLRFHNKLDRKEKTSLIVERIINLLKLDGKTIDSGDIPFEQVTESTAHIHLPNGKKDKKRMIDILKKYNLNYKKGLLKCSPKEILGHKLPGDTLRYVVDKQDDIWKVLLIDPWHLFATKKYNQNYEKFKNKARFCISQLNLDD